jgi:hypothetical protein
LKSKLRSSSEALESWRAEDAHKWMPGFSKWSPGGSVEQWSQIAITLMRSSIRTRIEVKRWIRIRIKVKIQKPFRDYRGSRAVDAQKAWRLKMEPWRF